MSNTADIEDFDLSDSELVQVLKNHGMSRRVLMTVFGAGVVASAFGGTAAAKRSGGASIDSVYGATFFEGERVPSGLSDHEVELHAHDVDDDEEADPFEFFFDPVGLHVAPGDVVEFEVHGPVTHTVTSFHPYYEELPERVPTDDPYTSPPIGADPTVEDAPGDVWLYRFETPGVHDVVCLPHLPLGMVMRIVVFDPKRDSLSDPTFDEWGPLPPVPVFGPANTVLTDDELDPQTIVSEGEIPWSDLGLP
jgi:plastocyanin